MILPMLERLKQTSVFGLMIIKVNTVLFEKENKMYQKSVFIHTIATKVLMIGKSLYLYKCETHKQLKESATFWQHKLKTIYPLDLNEKEEHLF